MQFGGQPTPWSEVEIEGLRLRSVSQILIQEIGAAGPENAEESARRACGVIQHMADQIVSADARIADMTTCALRNIPADWRPGYAWTDDGVMNVLAEYVDELRQRAEKSEDRLAAIDGAQTVAVIRDEDYPHIYRLIEDRFKLPPIGTELIARPTKD